MNYLNDTNKALLWSLLQENDMFNGLPNEKYSKVKVIFEETLNDINSKYNNLQLIEKNKITIAELIKKINTEKNSKIQVVYNAGSNKKMNNFDKRLKESQDNMNSLLVAKKPEEINFNDKPGNDDEPIGDNMDRLLSERLATRERELDIPSITPEAELWLNNGKKDDASTDEKKVTFNIQDNSIQDNNIHETVVHKNNIQYISIQDNSIHDDNNIQDESILTLNRTQVTESTAFTNLVERDLKKINSNKGDNTSSDNIYSSLFSKIKKKDNTKLEGFDFDHEDNNYQDSNVDLSNVDSVVKSVMNKFVTRSKMGKKKYGTDLDRNDLKPHDWIQHAQEELMDGILYLEKLKIELK